MLGKALNIQMRVLRSLITRETIRQFGRGNIGFLWLFIEPALLCIGVTAMWSLLAMSHHDGVTIAAYAVTGYMPLTLFRHMTALSVGIVQRNATLFYHRRITLMDIFMARMIQDFLATTLAFALLATVMSLLGLMEPPRDMRPVVIGWLLQGAIAFGFATNVAAAAQSSEIVEKFVPVIQYITLPITGAFMMVAWAPAGVRDLYLMVPLVHPYELIRDGFYGDVVETYGDPLYAGTAALLMTGVGLFFLNRAREHISLN